MNFERVQIGSCTLYKGDCMDVLPTLNDFDVDITITSPPYNLGNTTGGGFGKYNPESGSMMKRGGGGKWRKAAMEGGIGGGYGTHDDNMPHDEYVAWQKDVLKECWRVSRYAIYYNHKPRILDGLLVTPFEYNPDLPVRQVVIWARAGGINFSPTFYVPTHEWICIFAREEFRLKSKGASGVGDVWYIPQESNPLHPAPFPLDIPRRILETTGVKKVLDPFGGSGTTGVACVQRGVECVLIENDPVHFATACERVESAVSGGVIGRQSKLFAGEVFE